MRIVDRATGRAPVLHSGDSIELRSSVLEDGRDVTTPDLIVDGEPIQLVDVTRSDRVEAVISHTIEET